MEVRQTCILAELDMTSTFDLTASAPRHQDRKVQRVVRIAVTHAGAVDDRRMVQQGTIAIGRRSQLVEELCEQADVIGIDLDQLRKTCRVVLMMRNRVVRIGNAELGEGPAALLAADHECDNARQVALIGDGEQVVHQHRVLLKHRWNAGRLIHHRKFLRVFRFDLLDSPLDVANGLEIFCQLGAVAGPEISLQAGDFLDD